MSAGGVFWFNNQAHHEAWNNGDEDRIHFLIDFMPNDKIGKVNKVPVNV
jgi:hypothetical protein